MQFGHIEIFVKDPLASMEFYSGVLGFEVTDVQHERFVWMQSGTITVLLRPGDGGDKMTYQTAPNGFVIYTSDLEGAATRLRDKGVVFKGTDGSDRCLTFTDPDGHWLQLVDPNDH